MFILTVLVLLLSECRSVLWPTLWCTRSKRFRVSVKTKKTLGICSYCLKSDSYVGLGGFEWLLIFLIFLTLSVLEKLKNSIFEMPIITQTWNINNLRTTRANSINLDTIKMLVEYSLKNVQRRQGLFILFWRHCYLEEGRYCDSSSGTEGVKGLKCQ